MKTLREVFDVGKTLVKSARSGPGLTRGEQRETCKANARLAWHYSGNKRNHADMAYSLALSMLPYAVDLHEGAMYEVRKSIMALVLSWYDLTPSEAESSVMRAEESLIIDGVIQG